MEWSYPGFATPVAATVSGSHYLHLVALYLHLVALYLHLVALSKRKLSRGDSRFKCGFFRPINALTALFV